MNNTDINTLYMVVGFPASGKSTWAETHKDKLNAVIHSSDAIREEFGDINDQSKNTDVFQILHQRVKNDLKAGKNVIYDATNLNRKRRIAFLQEIEHIPCNKVCVLFATPFEQCLANNFSRERHVPEEVMVRMYKNFETPWYAEGWDDIQIIWWNYKDMPGFEYDLFEDMMKWCKISHDNPHHSLSIGAHMLVAHRYIFENNKEYLNLLLDAALLHDCGKPLVRARIDSKGNPCDHSHYYEHHNVGAYLCLFYLKENRSYTDKDILYISLLINLHMRPFLAWDQSDNAKEKDIRLFGDEIITNIEILHEADLVAH